MRDFTKGSIGQALFKLAVPIVLTNMLHTAYQLVDTFWVGRLGADAVAAVSLSFPLIFLMISLGAGFSIAGTILVAQHKGAKNEDQVQHVTAQTVVMMFLVSLVVSGLGLLIAEPVIRLMGAEPAVLPQAVSYLRVSYVGTIFMFGFFMFQSLMRGIGEVNTPMFIVFCTVMLNLVLDPLFINGWGPIQGYGVTGAAIATIFTQGLATAAGMWILMSGKRGIKLSFKGFKLDKPLIKKMFFLGLPSSIEQSMKALGLTIMTFLVATFGTVIVAAYGVGVRILTFVIIPAFGLSMATSTLVGQNMGAGKPERADLIGRKAAKIGFGVLVGAGIVVYLLARQAAETFIPGETEVIIAATTFIRFLVFSFGFIGLQLVFNGVFQGAGNTKVSMIFSIVSLWVFEFPLSYILSKHTDLAEMGLWIAFPIATAISAMVSLAYFRMGRWKEIKLIGKTAALEKEVLEETQVEEGPLV